MNTSTLLLETPVSSSTELPLALDLAASLQETLPRPWFLADEGDDLWLGERWNAQYVTPPVDDTPPPTLYVLHFEGDGYWQGTNFMGSIDQAVTFDPAAGSLSPPANCPAAHVHPLLWEEEGYAWREVTPRLRLEDLLDHTESLDSGRPAEEILDEYDSAPDGAKFCMVQRNVRHGGRWVVLVGDLEDAMAYKDTDEYAEEWDTESLVSLHTGTHYRAAATYTFEEVTS